MKIPDVVGASEAAEILGVELQRIPRWRESGKLPTPGADLAATPVWEREIIEAIANDEKPKRARPLPLVSTNECASILGDVDKSQIGRWRRAGQFPPPCLDRYDEKDEPTGLRAGPLWWRRDIVAFAKTRKREAEKRQAARK